MKQKLIQILTHVVTQLKQQAVLPQDVEARVQVDPTKDKTHGDFATNLAMMLAKPAGLPPRELAAKIIALLPQDSVIVKVEMAGPGFINFFVDDQAKFAVVGQVLTQQADFGRAQVGQGRSVLVEFVSANPTGPLHVGHGRGAAYGASLSSLLAFAGFEVK